MKPDVLQDVDQQRGAFATSWAEANQRYLIQEFVRLRARLGVEEDGFGGRGCAAAWRAA